MLLTPFAVANRHFTRSIDQHPTFIVESARSIVQDGTSNDQCGKMIVHSATLNDQCAELNVRCGTFIVQLATLNDQSRNSSIKLENQRSTCHIERSNWQFNVHFAILNDQGDISSTYF